MACLFRFMFVNHPLDTLAERSRVHQKGLAFGHGLIGACNSPTACEPRNVCQLLSLVSLRSPAPPAPSNNDTLGGIGGPTARDIFARNKTDDPYLQRRDANTTHAFAPPRPPLIDYTPLRSPPVTGSAEDNRSSNPRTESRRTPRTPSRASQAAFLPSSGLAPSSPVIRVVWGT